LGGNILSLSLVDRLFEGGVCYEELIWTTKTVREDASEEVSELSESEDSGSSESSVSDSHPRLESTRSLMSCTSSEETCSDE
jgi:hypothetical protein